LRLRTPPGFDGIEPAARALAGERVTGVSRRGKYAVIELASGRSLVTSLRMTGRLVVAACRTGMKPPAP